MKNYSIDISRIDLNIPYPLKLIIILKQMQELRNPIQLQNNISPLCFELDVDSNDKQNSKSIEFFLNRIGFGNWHTHIYFCIGLYYLTNGIQLITLPFLSNDLRQTWDLTDLDINILLGSLFTSYFIGSIVSGLIADRYGRKMLFIVFVFLSFLLGNICAWIPNFTSFLVLRSLYQFCVGVLSPLISVIVIEITPKDWRGKNSALIGAFYIIGQLTGVTFLVITYFTGNNWRLLVILETAPAVFALVMSSFWLTETPHFLAFTDLNKFFDLLDHINKINTQNNNKISREEKEQLTEYINEHKSVKQENQYLPMIFQRSYIKITFLIWIIWVFLSFVYVELAYITPNILCDLDFNSQINDIPLIPMVISIFVEFPSCILSYFVIETKYFGRKMLMFWSFVIASMFCISLVWSNGYLIYIFALLAKLFSSTGNIAIQTFTGEIYHSNFRTTGFGIAKAIGASAVFLIPLAINPIVQEHPLGAFAIYGCALVLAAWGSIFLPVDTRGKELNLNPNHSKDE